MIHSRIGTPIKDQEKTYISDRFNLDTKYGTIVARKISSSLNTFAIYLGKDTTSPIEKYKILTTENPVFSTEDRETMMLMEIEVDQSALLNYYGQPEHLYEPGKQYNLLETYLISLSQ